MEVGRRAWIAGLGILGLVASVRASEPPERWGGVARSPSRVSSIDGPFPLYDHGRWTRATDSSGLTITFHGQTGVVGDPDRVMAIGRVTPAGQGVSWRLFCFRADDGEPCWASPIPAPVLESWSSPWLCGQRDEVYVASGSAVICFDATTGVQRWQTALGAMVVNASPLVTEDLGHADRLFITDFDTNGVGRLHCLNVDSFHPVHNLYQPGQVVWSVEVGSTSGNTPAYLPKAEGGIGYVYIATASDAAFGPGQILAFPADATNPPAPAFAAPNPEGYGYYGGVSVLAPQAPGEDPAVYAASYNFWGGLFSSSLVRVNGRTGITAWSIPSNRSSAIPVPLGDGLIVLSGGVAGFGTVPSVTLYKDSGNGASRIWDSALDSWDDANSNGVLDPGEYLRVGGWTNQPACVRNGNARRAYVGVIPSSASALTPCERLVSLDLMRVPGKPGFVDEGIAGTGASPAIIAQTLYSVGAQGLSALGPPRRLADVNGDDRVSIDDLYAWEQGIGPRDVNADGLVDQADRRLLLEWVRQGERQASVFLFN